MAQKLAAGQSGKGWMRYQGLLSQPVNPKVLHGRQCISRYVEYTSGDAIATPVDLQWAVQHIPHDHVSDLSGGGEVQKSSFWDTAGTADSVHPKDPNK
jgi:hypothetical protein